MSDELVELSLQVPQEGWEQANAMLVELVPEGFAYADSEAGAVDVQVYVPRADAADRAETLASGLGVAVAHAQVAPDWAERWKEFHQPVVIGRLWVGPPWLLPAPEGLIPVVIEPGQGFGTGAHATTRLVLSMLAEQAPCEVVDIGCGSGVLAIAAAKLGFHPVRGYDNDAAAVESARANVEANDVDVRIELADALEDESPPQALALANIIIDPLVQLAPILRPDRVLVSGVLRSQVARCEEAFHAAGYHTIERRDRDGWVGLRFERPAVEPHRAGSWI